jgi:hypothetical protein
MHINPKTMAILAFSKEDYPTMFPAITISAEAIVYFQEDDYNIW